MTSWARTGARTEDRAGNCPTAAASGAAGQRPPHVLRVLSVSRQVLELKDEAFQEQTGHLADASQLDITETLSRGDGHLLVARGNSDGNADANPKAERASC